MTKKANQSSAQEFLFEIARENAQKVLKMQQDLLANPSLLSAEYLTEMMEANTTATTAMNSIFEMSGQSFGKLDYKKVSSDPKIMGVKSEMISLLKKGCNQ